MSWADGAGLIGVFLMLAAYAAAQIHVLDPVKPPSLAMNLAGACLVILSLTKAFNLSAFLIEAAWALIAAAGLIRAAITRRWPSRGPRPPRQRFRGARARPVG